ncbi:hypothetical protein V8E54_014409 [Elaphomyces granulatus]
MRTLSRFPWQTAVNIYMRMVDSVDSSTDVVSTKTPSEPILAYAAMRHLCRGMSWALSIRTFATKLLNNGVIDKGRKGELYSRLILTLGHDNMAGIDARDASFNNVLLTFTVEKFLKPLYGKLHHTTINSINPDILRARMDFSSFTSTDEYLTADSFERLCYILLR